MALHPDRLFPSDPSARSIARRLYHEVASVPILSPHGHTDPRWYGEDALFPDPATLFVKPDHYIFRMLYSQGVALEDLGIFRRDGGPVETDGRKIWRILARHFHLFRGTPTRLWFEQSLEDLFGITERLKPENADLLYDIIADHLGRDEFRPRALYARFNIEAISTTDSPLSNLAHHAALRRSGWKGRVLPAYRPDFTVDPEREGFVENLRQLVAITGQSLTWQGYLAAHRMRREFFKSLGATSTDHGHLTAQTADLPLAEAEALFNTVLRGAATAAEAEAFRAQMLTEMARMSIDDGLVMQLHPGSFRNHNPLILRHFGRIWARTSHRLRTTCARLSLCSIRWAMILISRLSYLRLMKQAMGANLRR